MYDFNDLNDNYELQEEFKKKIKVIYFYNHRLKRKLKNFSLMKP